MSCAAAQANSLQVTVKVDPGSRIATMTLSGVLTPSSLRWYCNEALPKGLAGFVTRADRVIVAIEAEAASPSYARHDLRGIPAAIVAPPSGVEFAERYASVMCEQGIPRKAFTSVSLAFAWVRAEVLLRQEQARWQHLRFAASA